MILELAVRVTNSSSSSFSRLTSTAALRLNFRHQHTLVTGGQALPQGSTTSTASRAAGRQRDASSGADAADAADAADDEEGEETAEAKRQNEKRKKTKKKHKAKKNRHHHHHHRSAGLTESDTQHAVQHQASQAMTSGAEIDDDTLLQQTLLPE